MDKVKDWNYKVIKKIGEGGYGEVYLCRNRETHQKVAIKMITLINVRLGFPSYIIREVSILKELEHDNIVRLLNVRSSGKYVYLVFEYLDLDLFTFIESPKKTSNSLIVKAALKQILAGLAYCHSHKIIHRDLKPENVLVDLKKNIVKLADFGLARPFGIPLKEYSSREIPYSYKSPEELLGQFNEYSIPVDVWAVGCIFAEMITGDRVFPFGKRFDQMSTICSLMGTPTEETWPGVTLIGDLLPRIPYYEPVDLAREFPELEPAGVELLSRMLCLNPNHRIAAAEAVNHEYLEGVENVSFALRSTSFLSLSCVVLRCKEA
ncbi:hypothetical protein ACOSP7_019213 [Xanthoceras sorbifolium]